MTYIPTYLILGRVCNNISKYLSIFEYLSNTQISFQDYYLFNTKLNTGNLITEVLGVDTSCILSAIDRRVINNYGAFLEEHGIVYFDKTNYPQDTTFRDNVFYNAFRDREQLIKNSERCIVYKDNKLCYIYCLFN